MRDNLPIPKGDHLVWLMCRVVPGMTEAELARQLGITRKTVNDYRHGHSIPSKVRQQQLCNLARLTVEELKIVERDYAANLPMYYLKYLVNLQETITEAVEHYSRTL